MKQIVHVFASGAFDELVGHEGGAGYAVAGAKDGKCVLGIRPESVTLGSGPFRGEVHDFEPHGRETIYHLTTPLGTLRALEPGAAARFKVGDSLSFGLSTSLLFDAGTTRRIESAKADVTP